MPKVVRWLALAAAAGAAFASGAFGQSARDVVGPTPWETLDNQPPPKLILDPPLAEPLSRGAIVMQYRVENFHIVPIVGAAATTVSPRIGHLHIGVDGLPWHWAQADDSNTIIIVGLPPGPHKISVDLADPQHHVLTGQVVNVTVPAQASPAH
jgi:hypothetical protein